MNIYSGYVKITAMNYFRKIVVTTLFLFLVAPSPFSDVLAGSAIAPTITLSPTIYYAGDEVLHIEGKAEPSSNVEIVFNSIDWAPKSFTVGSDATGKWVFLQRLFLDKGRWEVKVRNTTSTATNGVWSDPVDFISVPTLFVVSGVKIKFSTFNSIILASVASFLIIATYAFFRYRSVQKEVRAFRKGATDRLIRGEMDDVRKDIAKELWHLEKKLKQTQSFTPEESEHRERLMRELKKYEKDVEDEIMEIM